MKNTEHIVRLSDSIGAFIEYWGFKKIHGRLWCYIYLSENPISTPELVSALDVSKGLVSIAINELLEFELITEGPKGVYGAKTYVAEEATVAKVVRQVLRNRELQLVSNAEACMETLSSFSDQELKEVGISAAKLKSVQELTKSSRSILEFVIRKNVSSIVDWIQMIKSIRKIWKVDTSAGN